MSLRFDDLNELLGKIKMQAQQQKPVLRKEVLPPRPAPTSDIDNPRITMQQLAKIERERELEERRQLRRTFFYYPLFMLGGTMTLIQLIEWYLYS